MPRPLIMSLPIVKSSKKSKSLKPVRSNAPTFSLNTASFNSDIKPLDDVSQNISNKLSTACVS